MNTPSSPAACTARKQAYKLYKQCNGPESSDMREFGAHQRPPYISAGKILYFIVSAHSLCEENMATPQGTFINSVLCKVVANRSGQRDQSIHFIQGYSRSRTVFPHTQQSAIFEYGSLCGSQQVGPTTREHQTELQSHTCVRLNTPRTKKNTFSNKVLCVAYCTKLCPGQR